MRQTVDKPRHRLVILLSLSHAAINISRSFPRRSTFSFISLIVASRFIFSSLPPSPLVPHPSFPVFPCSFPTFCPSLDALSRCPLPTLSLSTKRLVGRLHHRVQFTVKRFPEVMGHGTQTIKEEIQLEGKSARK